MATPHRGLIAVGDVANYRWDHLVLAGMRQRLAMVAIRALAAGAAARGGGSCSISLALIGQVSGKACCRHRWGNRCCPCGPTAINVGLHRSQIRGPGSIWTVCGRVFIPRPIVLRLPPDACAIGTSNARAICGFGFILCLFDPPGWEDPAALCLGVKGGEKVYHCGGGIVYHRHDEKGLNWEPGGIRSGAGVRSSGVSQESTGSSDTWEAALCRLCLRR